MKYLIDTNICIHFFRGKFNLKDKFEKVTLDNCAISEITLAEMIYGAENSLDKKQNYRIIDEFSEQVKVLPIFDALKIYAKEKVRFERKRTND
ncbi:PIN domain-containing protein [Mesohalobacter halotolerans]|uniref:PIN domain-containing protein n=1 Tax=Mesohalobacter halotolerans TaxID=1883405 RepID=UPI001FE3E7F9|nr:PIN domain-containing protein [Mesohalobacter halotolerans]